MAKVALSTWIASALTDPHKTGKCVGLTLVHRVGSSDNEIYSIQLGESQWDPQNLANIFKAKADVASQELHGSQLFWLLAFYAGSPEPQARFGIRCQGGADQEQDVTEDATPRGQHQQVMRVAESIMQAGIRQNQFLFEKQNELIGMLSTQLRATMSENAEAVNLVKKIILDGARDKHEYEMAQIKAKGDLAMQQKLLSLGPALINAMSGREVFPQSTADSSTMEALIGAISKNPKLIDILSQELDPEVLGLLAQRATEHIAQQTEVQEIARKALRNRDGEADVVGESGGPSAQA
jgi:hypothetical protein